MKEIKLEIKGTYEEIVEFIRNNYDIVEPTKFIFTKIVETNAKMRRLSKYKNVYEFEKEGFIALNDNAHKENLFKKVCIPKINYGYSQEYMARMGID